MTPYVRKIFANSFKGWSHVCVAGNQYELFMSSPEIGLHLFQD
jgi:hypothetical protein